MLEQYSKRHEDFDIIALRLADVIGPFDDTYRLWKYTTWMQAIHGINLKCFKSSLGFKAKDIPRDAFPKKIGYKQSDADQKLSFTFSYDVVKVLHGLVSREIKPKSKGF